MIWGVAGQRNKSHKVSSKGKHVGEVKGKFDIEWFKKIMRVGIVRNENTKLECQNNVWVTGSERNY